MSEPKLNIYAFCSHCLSLAPTYRHPCIRFCTRKTFPPWNEITHENYTSSRNGNMPLSDLLNCLFHEEKVCRKMLLAHVEPSTSEKVPSLTFQHCLFSIIQSLHNNSVSFFFINNPVLGRTCQRDRKRWQIERLAARISRTQRGVISLALWGWVRRLSELEEGLLRSFSASGLSNILTKWRDGHPGA